jgi:oligopeptide/dipeptide ABC transporter ATP-binding protein
MEKPLLEVKGLKTYFFSNHGTIRAADGVSFSVSAGETLGIVGESGCGKSVTSLSILNLIEPPGKITGGQILFKGEDIAGASGDRMRAIRGNEISMIFQEPMTSLNPVFRIREQIGEVLMLHRHMDKKEAWQAATALLGEVGIPRPEEVSRCYPHELSGGMRQRVMIAMALACSPELLIADEPTTALDVTIQAQILSLMNRLKLKTNTAILLITHDLGVVAQMADHVIVMYAGKVVESARTEELFEKPLHPYTQGLLASIPNALQEGKKLYTIPGTVPSPADLPQGCYFAPRCPHAKEHCRKAKPALAEVSEGRAVRCYLYSQEEEANE